MSPHLLSLHLPSPRELFVHPDPLKLMVGETAPVRAWSCPAGETPPFGEDKDPGTADDTCRDVEAEWSINDAGVAELGKDEAAKTRVTALAITEGDQDHRRAWRPSRSRRPRHRTCARSRAHARS